MPQPTPDLWLLFAAGAAMLGLAWLSRGAVRLPKTTARSEPTDRRAQDMAPGATEGNKQPHANRERDDRLAQQVKRVNLSA